jgi:hypothetical protein
MNYRKNNIIIQISEKGNYINLKYNIIYNYNIDN